MKRISILSTLTGCALALSVAGTAFAVSYASDANGDGSVGLADYTIWAANKQAGTVQAFSQAMMVCDFNHDGFTTYADIDIYNNHLGATVSTYGTSPVPGDANGDGRVGLADYAVCTANLQEGTKTKSKGDFNGDGFVTDADYDTWKAEYAAAMALNGCDASSPFVPGDANGDGSVGTADYTILMANKQAGTKTRSQGDFNGDGFVTHADYDIWNKHFGSTMPTPAVIPGDANGDGTVGTADYTLWAANAQEGEKTYKQGDFNGDGFVTQADYDIWSKNQGATASAPCATTNATASSSSSSSSSSVQTSGSASSSSSSVSSLSSSRSSVSSQKAEGSWNITDLDFSPRVKTNVKTGKNTLKIMPTFKYTGDADVTFGKSYIWSMACMLSDDTTSTDISQKEFSTGTSNVTVTNGQTVKSLMVVELDNKYLKPLRRGKLTMTCSLGYAKPTNYEKLSMGTEGSVTMSYILKLKGYRWIVEGWNF